MGGNAQYIPSETSMHDLSILRKVRCFKKKDKGYSYNVRKSSIFKSRKTIMICADVETRVL